MLSLEMLMVDLELDVMWLHAQNEASVLHAILVMYLNSKEKFIHVSIQSLLSSVHFCCHHSHPDAQNY